MVKFNKILFSSAVILLSPVFMYAADLSTVCEQILNTPDSCQNLSASECQATLESCASYYDQQSASIAQDLSKTQQQKNTLQNQITSLKKKISGLEAQINQGTLMVKDLNVQISDTQVSIDKTGIKIDDTRSKIADILQSVYQEDKKDPVIVLLEGNLSDFFSNLVYLENLNSKVSDLLESSRNLQDYLQNQKDKQEGEKTQLQKTIQLQSLQKQQNQQNQQQQAALLKLTEAQYQQQQASKADADKKAAAIKNRIFDLLGISNAPNFEQAVSIAKYVQSQTGVRAALVLAILTQESNLGKNVGQCYLKDSSTGTGVKIKTGVTSPKTMSPTRDVPIFLTITQSLGLDPYKTPVSCVIYYNGSPYGWGGAMGPAQFIPSTWINLGYDKKITAITGKTANPWNIQDAFLATGLLMRDNGAASGGSNAEFNAAMKYYCGGSCTSYDRFYGNSVISIANQYEADIKTIGG